MITSFQENKKLQDAVNHKRVESRGQDTFTDN